MTGAEPAAQRHLPAGSPEAAGHKPTFPHPHPDCSIPVQDKVIRQLLGLAPLSESPLPQEHKQPIHMEIREVPARSIPTRRHCPCPSEKAALSRPFRADASPSQPLLAGGVGRAVGAGALGAGTDLSASCWLPAVLKVSRERHGRDGEAPDR